MGRIATVLLAVMLWTGAALAQHSVTLNWVQGTLTYADWKASSTFANQVTIKPTAGNTGGYTFQATITSGAPALSGTAEPVWPQSVGVKTSADGGITYWTNRGISSVTSNNVLRGTTSGGPYSTLYQSTIPITTYKDTTVISGTTYYYVVTASNQNLQSGFSNQTQAVIPTGGTAPVTPGSVTVSAH